MLYMNVVRRVSKKKFYLALTEITSTFCVRFFLLSESQKSYLTLLTYLIVLFNNLSFNVSMLTF